jgi:hypothetical protein
MGGITSLENRDKRARQILARWEESRLPFILYLRSFRVTIPHGGGYHLENHFYALHSLNVNRVGVLTIVDPDEVPLPGARGHGAPALVLKNDEWKATVADLIPKAAMIVSEVPVLSGGAAFELQACIDQRRRAGTVVIIPPPDSVIEALDDHPLISNFPRVLWSDELPDLSPSQLFVFRDLLERAIVIAKLPPDERRRLTDSGELLSRFPIILENLHQGYEAFAAGYLERGELARAARTYFRAIVAASANKDTEALVVLAEKTAHVQLAMGDRDRARNYLEGAARFARELNDLQRISRLERLLDTLK